MKHTLYILLLFSLSLNAQIKTGGSERIKVKMPGTIHVPDYDPPPVPLDNLVGYWSTEYGINADSTIYLLNKTGAIAATIDLVGLDWDITNDSLGIPLKTAAYMDWVGTPTIDTAFWNWQVPPCVVFQNVDYDSTTYFKIAEQVLNADSTELYPARIKEIAVYSTATDAVAYFEVPAIIAGAKWIDFTLGNDDTGDGSYAAPYKTISKVNGLTLSAGTQVYVKSGSYSLGAVLTLTKTYNYRGIGYNEILIGSTYYIRKTTNASEFFGFDIKANTTNAYMILADANISSKYNRFVQNGANCHYSQTHTTATTISDNIYTGTSTTTVLYLKVNNDFTIENNFISPTSLKGFVRVDNSAIGGYVNFNYNKFITSTNLEGTFFNITYTNNRYNPVIKYNHIETNSSSFDDLIFSLVDRDSVWIEKNYIKDNGTATTIPIAIISTGVDVDTLLISSNFIDHDGPYAIVVGSESTGVGDNHLNNSIIEKNYIYGILNTQPSVESSAHSILHGFNQDGYIRYNKIKGSPYAIVIKGSSTIFDTAGAFSNIIINCDYGIMVKGVDSVKIYNNTILSNLKRGGAAIIINENNSEDGSRYCKVKNNIIVTDSSNQYSISIETFGLTGFESDYNVFYCRSGQPSFKVQSTVYNSLAEWQSATGQDAHSIVLTETQYNDIMSDYILTTPINGVDLGLPYKTGLDIATDFTDNQVPNVVTRQQGATWQIGAYVQE